MVVEAGKVGFIYENGGEGNLYGVAVSVFLDLYGVVTCRKIDFGNVARCQPRVVGGFDDI